MKCKVVTLKSGEKRWECLDEGPADPVTGTRNQIRRRAKTKTEAKQKVQNEINLLESEGLMSSKKRKKTFEEVAHEWIQAYGAAGKKRGSVRIREKDLNVLFRHIAKVPIEKITHSSYQKLLNTLAKEYSLNSLKSINTTANMVFKYAIRDNLIKHNPRTDAIIPRKQKTIEEIKSNPIEEKYLDTEELKQFFDSLHSNALELDLERFYVLAFSGMRPGELCALQKQDLDFTENTINIYKTIYNESNNMKEYILTPPKTSGSVRVVNMDEKVMSMLRKLATANDRRKLNLRVHYEDFHDKDFLFCRANGYPYITKTVLNRMDRLIQSTNIKKRATPHIFRHTYISMMAEAKVDLPTIMQQVGHEDIETTMKVYTHVTNKMKKDAPTKVTNLYGNILEKIIL